MGKATYKILHEDQHLVIVDKPTGLLTIPDRYRPDIPNLYQQLQKKYPEIYIVHRIDKGTSGVICFAKDKDTHKALSQQFEAREPVKKYYALVKGAHFSKKDV